LTDYTPPNRWIWQQADWPEFRWDHEQVHPLLREAHTNLGILLGRAGSVAGGLDEATALDALLQNIITSSAIEGEGLNAASVRSSLARRLGIRLEDELTHTTSSRTEGLAELMMDAVQNPQVPLSLERLLKWHCWLFPDDEPRLISIRVGQLRGDDPMQVVSGRIDKPKIHFEAPSRSILDEQLAQFIDWFNQSNNPSLDPLVRAAITHFWFITLHPFDDGNGRITRALTDLALAQADAQSIRLYAMSAAILASRSDYYRILEKSQSGDLNITDWLEWFLLTLNTTLQMALATIDRTLQKRRFWQQFHTDNFSAEQRKILNRLLDGGERGFEGGISAAQYQKVAKVSKATATRHLSDLLDKGCLQKLPGGGRSTRYQIARILTSK
jgi:Fic family protein